MISNSVFHFFLRRACAGRSLKKKFMDECKQNGNKWCLIVRAMDNPVLGVGDQEDVSDIVMGSGFRCGHWRPATFAGSTGWTLPTGRESLVRGARLTGLTLRAMRNVAGIGNDSTPFTFMQSQRGRVFRDGSRRVRLGRFRRPRYRGSPFAAV